MLPLERLPYFGILIPRTENVTKAAITFSISFSQLMQSKPVSEHIFYVRVDPGIHSEVLHFLLPLNRLQEVSLLQNLVFQLLTLFGEVFDEPNMTVEPVFPRSRLILILVFVADLRETRH